MLLFKSSRVRKRAGVPWRHKKHKLTLVFLGRFKAKKKHQQCFQYSFSHFLLQDLGFKQIMETQLYIQRDVSWLQRTGAYIEDVQLADLVGGGAQNPLGNPFDRGFKQDLSWTKKKHQPEAVVTQSGLTVASTKLINVINLRH